MINSNSQSRMELNETLFPKLSSVHFYIFLYFFLYLFYPSDNFRELSCLPWHIYMANSSVTALFNCIVIECACWVTQSCLTLCGPLDGSLSMGIFRQEYWSGLPFPPPEVPPNPGIRPASPALTSRFFTTELPEKPTVIEWSTQTYLVLNHGKQCIHIFPLKTKFM